MKFHEISRNFTLPLCKPGYPPIARDSVQDLYLWGPLGPLGPLGASGDMVPDKVA